MIRVSTAILAAVAVASAVLVGLRASNSADVSDPLAEYLGGPCVVVAGAPIPTEPCGNGDIDFIIIER